MAATDSLSPFGVSPSPGHSTNFAALGSSSFRFTRQWNTSTPMGRAMFHIAGVFAENSSERSSASALRLASQTPRDAQKVGRPRFRGQRPGSLPKTLTASRAARSPRRQHLGGDGKANPAVGWPEIRQAATRSYPRLKFPSWWKRLA